MDVDGDGDAAAAAAAPAKPRIVFDVQPPAGGPDAQRALEEAAAKNRRRAEKFGIDYVDPQDHPSTYLAPAQLQKVWTARGPTTRAEAEAAGGPAGGGFATGIDLFSDEERLKKESRAAKYGLAVLGDTKAEAEKAAKLAKRAERFGASLTAPLPGEAHLAAAASADDAAMDVDAAAERTEPPPPDVAPRRAEAVHVYGVDVMSSAEILGYFKEYGPRFVEWLNDSSCNVVFADGFSAKRAILTLGKAAAPTASAAGADAAGAGADEPAARWHRGPDYSKKGVAIPLTFRLATTADMKSENRPMPRGLWREPRRGREPQQPARRKRRRRAGGEEEDGYEGEEGAEGGEGEGEGEELLSIVSRSKRAMAAEAAPGDGAEGAAKGGAAPADAAAAATAPLETGDLRFKLSSASKSWADEVEEDEAAAAVTRAATAASLAVAKAAVAAAKAAREAADGGAVAMS